jgi:hypothetical protein
LRRVRRPRLSAGLTPLLHCLHISEHTRGISTS